MKDNNTPLTALLIDADYIDRTTFEFIVNFERVLGRRISQGDFCHWLDCLCLDGGLKPGENKINVSLLHEADTKELKNWATINGCVSTEPLLFKDNLGEFDVEFYPVEKEVTDKETFFKESIKTLNENKQIERIILVPDWAEYGEKILPLVDSSKETTVLTFEPFKDRRCYVENLGYSLASALGIKGDELK